MDVVAVIQARVGSTRLPKKVLLRLEGKTVLEHVISRVEASKKIDQIIVATTTAAEDQVIADLCKRIGIHVYRGSENDVLDRYYQAVLPFKPNHIVRITADCPLMDPKVIDWVVTCHLNKKADYTANIFKETFPDGLDVEAFTFETLKRAWEEAALASEREHVTPFIRKRKDLFKQENIECGVNLGGKRWTLDNQEDFEFIKAVYEALYSNNPLFSMEEVLMFLEQNPEIEIINSHITRNEGYQKSLENDKKLKGSG